MTYPEIEQWLDENLERDENNRVVNPYTPKQFIKQFGQKLYDVKAEDYIEAGYIRRPSLEEKLLGEREEGFIIKESYHYRTKSGETRTKFIYRDRETGRFTSRTSYLTSRGTQYAES